jgi:hypothetical protein
MNWYVPNDLKVNFISGFTFYKNCKWSICPRYKQSFIPDKVENNDLVFLNLDYVEHFISYITKNTPKSKFRLVTHNSDRDFTYEMFSKLENYCNKIYAINCTFQNEKVIKIPIGFNDQSTEVLDKQDFEFINKDNLIYLNFRTGHHISRKSCFEYFSKFDWVNINDETKYLPVSEFYSKLKHYKYCISPRGAGIDTHRLYECLLFGVIPIIKSSELDDLYEGMPFLKVNEWSEITHDFLIQSYEENLSKYFEWKEKNKNWFLPEFWLHK